MARPSTTSAQALKRTVRVTHKPTTAQATSDLGTVEREMIARVLRETRWNKSKAAKRLGLSRTQLYVRLKKYGLEEPPPLQN